MIRSSFEDRTPRNLYAENSPYRRNLDQLRASLDAAKFAGDREQIANLRTMIDAQLDTLISITHRTPLTTLRD